MSQPFRDHYFHRAKKERYLTRSVYKLQEIQKKYKLLRRGSRVLDLGAFPGSWMQFIGEATGPKGRVVGVDLKEVEHSFPPHVTTMQRDVLEPGLEEELRRFGPFDAVVSDMAPSTSGVKVADSARSALLFETALHLARRLLVPRGHFLGKIFQGSEFHALLREIKGEFDFVKVIKPDATRKSSKEIYILAMRFKHPFQGSRKPRE